MSVRLGADFQPVREFSASNDVAAWLVLGTVQSMDDETRITMRLVKVETSEILESASGDSSGAEEDSVPAAAEHAISAEFVGLG